MDPLFKSFYPEDHHSAKTRKVEKYFAIGLNIKI